jgi:molybdenum cofactor guanylyltransferase
MDGLETIPVVILAGGLGARIGGNKSVRMLSGKTLFDRSHDRCATYSPRIAVATGKSSRLKLPDGLIALTDTTDNAGPISGLASAFDFAAREDATFVLLIPCDTPFLPEDLMTRLQQSIGECNAALATSDGRIHAACSLWRADAAGDLPDYLASGRRSMIGFAEAIGYAPVEWPSQPFDPFFNVNDEEDLANAEKILARMEQAS